MKQSEMTKIYSGKTSQQSNGLCGSRTLKLKEKEKKKLSTNREYSL